jgi:dihydroorotase
VTAGVTAVNDAGSLGYLHLEAFEKLVLPGARSDVFVFLHVSPFGEVVLPEIGYEIVDPVAFRKVVEAYPQRVRGIKVRAVGELLSATQVDVIGLACRLARECGLPLMVHLGMGCNEPLAPQAIEDFITRMLGQLEPGDILTHVYTDKPGGVFNLDGTPKTGLETALARGVFLDAAPGRGHLNFNLAAAAIGRGFAPHALGTDTVRLPEEQPHFYNVAAVASKFMALGLSLSEAIAAVTCNPAQMLGEARRRGRLKPGFLADLTLVEWMEGDFLFHDGRAGNLLPGEVFLRPTWTVKNGRLTPVRESYRAHVPTREKMERILRTT